MSEKLQAKVQIGSVNLGLLNRIVIDDLTLNDQQGVRMLKVSRLSASINYVELFQGNIVIPTAQLFSPKAVLYKDSLEAEANYQFLLDAFRSDEKEPETELNLRINSFILRHANISYDVKNMPHREEVGANAQGVILYRLDPHHIQLKDAGMNVSIKALTNDSLNVAIRRLTMSEKNSGLSVGEFNLCLEANRQKALLTAFSFKMPHSNVAIDTLQIHYPEYTKNSAFSIVPTKLTAHIVPSDLKSLLPPLHGVHSPLHLTATAHGDNRQISLDSLTLQNTDGSIRLQADAVASLDAGHLQAASAFISGLHVSDEGVRQIFNDLDLNEEALKPVLLLGNIDYTGTIRYTPEATLSEGKLLTQSGNLDYQATIDPSEQITAHLLGQELNLGTLLGNEQYGLANIDIHATGTTESLLSAEGQFDVEGSGLAMQSELAYHRQGGMHNLDLILDANNVNPHALGLTGKYRGEQYQFYLQSHLTGSNIDDLLGYAKLYDIRMESDSALYELNAININIERESESASHYIIESDFLTADLQGNITPSKLPDCLVAMLHPHLPSLIPQQKVPKYLPTDINFTYTARLTDNALVRHLLGGDIRFTRPVRLSGSVNTSLQEMSLKLETREIEYAGNSYNNVALYCDNTPEQLSAQFSGITAKDESAAKIDIYATAGNNTVNSNINLQLRGNTQTDMALNSRLTFTDSLGHTKTNLHIDNSSLNINDTIWQVSPAYLSLCDQEITCNNLRIYNQDSHIAIDGTASPALGDSIVIQLNNIQIEYLLDAINFTSVNLGGYASGHAVIDDLFSGNPYLQARLHVRGLTFESGLMGDADITGHWDSERKAIMLDADIAQSVPVSPSAPSGPAFLPALTTLHGYVSPANDDIRLDITADNTPAEFLNGYLDNIFNPISGNITGRVSVVGPLSKVNLVGDVDASLNLSLLATDVPYAIDRQHITLTRDTMLFADIAITDRFGNRGTIDGSVTHTHLSNFRYNFDVRFNRLLAYEEKTFNIDKFYATIFADGNLNLHGRDGHPMYLRADITPTRGSVFAYDAASPDAIIGNSFIQFRDATPRDTIEQATIDYLHFNYFESQDSIFGKFLIDQPLSARRGSTNAEEQKGADEVYHGDLYMDFNINLNEDCEIKLRMDNSEEGYISTRGNGALTAKYHNKGSLELFGTYNITSGRYRLYLQDIIYKDLVMQPGSSVEFNGPPFDADIHLICHHLINSVPLIDLTATTGLTQSSKVKVNCILDITGNLGNMAFKFDLDILNANDEVKQLVRSMINSEEEMNTQMIYLLALGRFYPINMARANTDEASSAAVNSLVSSTISGQINNIISNLVGRDSNWTFGTGISTGERGWQDLDVEGTLSGHLFNDRLLINGNFGYRDNALTNQGNFIGDFEVKWRLKEEGGNMYLKAYNQTNDRYFTKATLNTQGIGLSYMHDFDSWRHIFSHQPSRTASAAPVTLPDSLLIRLVPE